MRPTPLAPQRDKRFRRPLLAGLLAVLAGGIAGGAVLARQALRAAPPVASSSSGSTTAWEPRWTPGFRYTYSFAWSGDTHAHLGSASAEAVYDVAGRLEVRAAATAGGTVLELSLSDVTRHTLRAFGIDTVRGDDDARTLLETPRAWAEVGPKGVIERVRFAVDAPKPFEGLMTKLVEQMQATGPTQFSETALNANAITANANSLPITPVKTTSLLAWEEAQRPFVGASHHLADSLQADVTLRFAGSPGVSSAVPVRGLRSVAGPAVAIELSNVAVTDPNQLVAMAAPLATAIVHTVIASRGTGGMSGNPGAK